jgi:quinol-cytochrome oxidoreductase complex cytochrome b subunit
MHPTLAGVIIPAILVVFLVVLPYIDHSKANAGVWFSSDRGKRIVVGTALYTLVVMAAYILLDNAFSLRELLRGVLPEWIAQGLLPAAIIAVLVMLPAIALWRLRSTGRCQMATARGMTYKPERGYGSQHKE